MVAGRDALQRVRNSAPKLVETDEHKKHKQMLVTVVSKASTAPHNSLVPTIKPP